MIYDIRHVTKYSYEARVSSAKLALRLTPFDGVGQRCLRHALTIRPQPRQLVRERDFFGNDVTIALIDTSLIDLEVEATARVEVSRPVALLAGASPDWRVVAESAIEDDTLDASSPVHHLFPSPRVMLVRDVAAYAALSFPPGMPVVDGARDLARRIRKEFAYKPNSTEVSTPLDEAFKQRRGVCQDFAHIMISTLR